MQIFPINQNDHKLICDGCNKEINVGSIYYLITVCFNYRVVPNIPDSNIFCSKECFLKS